ncbi:hypothetical protein EMCRGX_G016842 [Ephydatia muelleri]
MATVDFRVAASLLRYVEATFFDEEVRICFSTCIAVDISADHWQQAQLSLRFGGSGFQSLSHHSHVSFISSLASSGFGSAIAIIIAVSAILKFNALVSPSEVITVESALSSPLSQHALSKKLDEHLFQPVLAEAFWKSTATPVQQMCLLMGWERAKPEACDVTVTSSLTSGDALFQLNPLRRKHIPPFTPDPFTPDPFTPDPFTPDPITPDPFTPDPFTPDPFTPDPFTPDPFTPDPFTPDSFTPDPFTPDPFTPDLFTPDPFTPDPFTPDPFTPDPFTPDPFTSDPFTSDPFTPDPFTSDPFTTDPFTFKAEACLGENIWCIWTVSDRVPLKVETCHQAHIGFKVEVGINLSRDHSKTCPADILLPNWFLGKTAALDVSSIAPFNPITLLETGVSATAAAQPTESRKHQTNDLKCSELGWVCVPMVVETYGVWGKEVIAVISSVASGQSPLYLEIYG